MWRFWLSAAFAVIWIIAVRYYRYLPDGLWKEVLFAVAIISGLVMSVVGIYQFAKRSGENLKR